MAIQGDGKIVVAGYSSVWATGPGNFAVARYNADGSLDATFGALGVVITDFKLDPGDPSRNGAGQSVVVLGDGSLVVAGYVGVEGAPNDFAVARFNANGSRILGFGTGGLALAGFAGNGDDIGLSVAVQGDGKIAVAGYSAPGGSSNLALARFNSDGSLDATFGTGGKIVTDFGGEDHGYSLVIQADGKILVAGDSSVGGTYNWVLVRYDTGGSLDASFGAGGKVTTDFGGIDAGLSVALRGDKIVAAGYSNAGGTNDFAVARYNMDGVAPTPTPTFTPVPPTPTPTATPTPTPTPVPSVGSPGLLVLALGLATLARMAATRGERAARARGL